MPENPIHPVDLLIDNAVADSHVLHHNLNVGDRMEVPRDLDFVFLSPERKKVETVSSFVTDNRYGVPEAIVPVELDDGRPGFRLVVVVHAPGTHPVVHSISGLMCMVAALFGVHYDGWGCVVQRPAAPGGRTGGGPPPMPQQGGPPSGPPPLPRS